MERYRVRASYNNNGDHPNSFFHSKPSASSPHLSLPPKPPISPQSSLSRRIHDAEISIFDAERYFNEVGDDQDTSTTALKKKINSLTLVNVPRNSSASSVGGGGGGYGLRNSTNYSRTRSFRATPTAFSEASWNSQTGLLANPPGAVAVSVRAYPLNQTKKGSNFRGGRSFFGRHCPCYGKKSVDVEHKLSETRSPVRSHCSPNPSQGFPKIDHVDVDEISSNNSSSTVPMMTKFKIRATEPGLLSLPEALDIGCRSGTGSFSFPVLISPSTAVPALPKESEEPARESLEVFRPPEIRRPVDEDDMASDTSSDLFELESFSAAHSSAYRRRDSLEELTKFATATATAGAGMLQFRLGLEEEAAAPSECYAPSEASVEWSVTTAEAGFDRTSVANFSSAASDCGKERSDSITAAAVAKKRGGGGLLSCRCEKAVSVGPNPVRFGPDQQRLVTGPTMLPGPVPVNRSV